jgi:diguanylate cyclase (GGDEF)-like protein
MNAPLDAYELRSLSSRLRELERERSDAREQAQTLVALQDTFTAIARSRSPDEVIALALRAAYAPLGFSRAIYFSVDRERGVEATFAIDGSDVVEAYHDLPDLRDDSALVAMLRGEGGEGTGIAGELSAPLVDVRRWYVMSALERGATTLGIIYVDDHRSPAPVAWETGLVRALATIAAVSLDNAALFAKTEELATRDPLTGLLNRRAFGERIAAAFARPRSPAASHTYIVIDVDDFKSINDLRGHAHGDTVLKSLAKTLEHSSRAQDIVGRFAGDEFVGLLVDVDTETARTLVARLSADLRSAGLRCSIGAALYPQDGDTPEGVFAAADRALYATKAAGKNGYSFA